MSLKGIVNMIPFKLYFFKVEMQILIFVKKSLCSIPYKL